MNQGEIRILPEAEPDLEKILDELIGCLGQGPAEEYDFNLDFDFDRVEELERHWVINPPTA